MSANNANKEFMNCSSNTKQPVGVDSQTRLDLDRLVISKAHKAHNWYVKLARYLD